MEIQLRTFKLYNEKKNYKSLLGRNLIKRHLVHAVGLADPASTHLNRHYFFFKRLHAFEHFGAATLLNI